MSFRTRTTFLETLDIKFEYFKLVVQWAVNNVDEVNDLYVNALAWGCDGLILRSLEGKYKFGRGTIKEGLIFKMKPFQTFDAKIVGIIQATEVREGAEKKINELGRSVTSKKKDDRVLIPKAAAFVVMYKGKELKVTIAMTDEEKEEVWENQYLYLGRMIEYKGMLVGAKENGLPRHPVFIRFRMDKDENS
jgi:DNA ligase-1